MLISSIIFINPLSRAVRGETLSLFTADFYRYAQHSAFHWNWTTAGIAVIGAFVVALALGGVLRGIGELRKRGVGFMAVFLCAAVAIALYAGTKPPPTPPPIRVKDIKITHYKCDHTGLEIQWQYGTNVVYGTDKFIIQRATRQIPARKGWSAFTDFAETMTTNYVNNTPFHAEDNRFKVIVRKVAN